MEGSAGVVCVVLRMYLLSTPPYGTHVACRPVSITVQAVSVHLAQNLQIPRIDVSHAAVQEVKGLHPEALYVPSMSSVRAKK